MSSMHYRPNEFADLAGVSVKTLHRWDKSGKLKPLRTVGGHRYYTEKHISPEIAFQPRLSCKSQQQIREKPRGLYSFDYAG